MKDNSKLILFLPMFILLCNLLSCQVSSSPPVTTTTMPFPINEIAVNEFVEDLGAVADSNFRMERQFVYHGAEHLAIRRTWTEDPHFIYDYPKGILQKDSVYNFTICFYFKGRKGPFKKRMGFILTNDERVNFTFTGTVIPKKSKN